LGIRGIRRDRTNEASDLRIQVRAMLRAARDREIGILIPMVTTTDDVRWAQRVLSEAQAELRSRGDRLPRSVRMGAMIEIPAAAVSVQEILAEVDFVSLGTNDLLQYFMAADRDNEWVAQYHQPDHPAFLWLLEYIYGQAAAAGRAADVMVCGEIASDSRCLPHLLRLGYRSLSIAPVATPMVREAIATTALQQTHSARQQIGRPVPR
jgi:phosphotransferase system enzyme I (PtsI)